MRRDRSRIRPDRHDDHAFGEAARASASVSTVSRSSAWRVPHPLGHGLDGRRVVRVAGRRGLGQQQVPADQQGDQLDTLGVEAHPGRDRAGDRLAGHAVLGEAALADVVEQRRHHQDVRPVDPPDHRRRLDARLHHVPVDGEAVDLRGVRQQPDPLPLGQQRGERAGLLERLPGAEQPAAGRQQPHQQVARLGRPRARAGARTRGPAGPRSAAPARRPARRPPRRRAAAGPGPRRAGPAGRARSRPPPGRPPRRPAPATAARAEVARSRASSTRRQVSRDRWVIRRPSSRTRDLRGPGVRDAQQRCQVAPHLGRDPVRRPAGQRVHLVAHVEHREPAALELDVRHVDQPGGDQRLQHRRVPDPALGLLEVRHRRVGQLAHQLVPRVDQRPQGAQPLPGVAPPLA